MALGPESVGFLLLRLDLVRRAMRVMERTRRGWLVVWLTVVGLLLVGLVRPVVAEGPTLARLSFWVPPERMAEFQAAYEEQVVPILEKHGLVETFQRGRATVDGVFARLSDAHCRKPAPCTSRTR